MRIIKLGLATLGLMLGAMNLAHAGAWTAGSTSGAPGANVVIPIQFAGDTATISSQATISVAAPLSIVSAVGANGQSCSLNAGTVGIVLFSFTPLPDPATTYCNVTIAINVGAAPGNYPVNVGGQLCAISGGNPAPACTATNGSVTVAGANVPPSIAYNPAAGATINYTGAGTATAIVATPSGGNGSGAAATTTVGACAITGGGAAFPVTIISQLSFVGSTVTPQNLALPNCTPQAAAVNATLTCPETLGAGASVNRVWTLNCPAAAVVNTPPTIAYNPNTGTTINYTGAGTATAIVATPSAGAGSGAAATTTVGACTISAGGAAFPVTSIAQLSFVGATVTPQNLALPNCTPQAAAVNATLTCPETRGAAAAVNRVWTLNCPAAAVVNTPPTIAYNPNTGTTINYTGAGTATAIVATPSAGSGSGAAATTTVGACTISAGGAAFPVTSIAQLSFVGATVTPQNLTLPNCAPQAAAVNATLTCPETRGAAAAVNRVWTLNCPAAAVVNTPPTIAYNPNAGTTINYTGAGTASAIVATPSGGSGSGAVATTTVGACAIAGGGAAFPVTSIAQLSFVGATVTPQNLVLPNCTPQAASVNATLTCPETPGAGAAVNRVWTLNCPAAAPVNTAPTIAYNPNTGTTINYTGAGTATAIVATPSGGTGSGAAATTTVGACTITGGAAAFPVTSIAQLSFVGATVTPQNLALPNCAPQAASVNATLTCPETRGAAAAVPRTWTLNCPAAAPANIAPSVAFTPATGSTISYTGAGTAASIVVTPSGGSGSGAAATTTFGACTITAGGAAFPTTSIAQLSFVGGTVTPQNLVLPNCVPQAAQVNATLTCPLSLGGGAATNQVWTLNCPAAVVGNTPPTITYTPAAGSTVNVASNASSTIQVGCPTDGAACNGSGSGLAATARLEQLSVAYAGPPFSPTPNDLSCAFVTEAGGAAGNTLDFAATAADAGDIRCSCAPVLIAEPYTVTVLERIPANSATTTATRTFNVVCGTGTCSGATINANPASGNVSLNNGGAAVAVSTVTSAGLPQGATQTVNCTVNGVSAGSNFTVTTVPTPLTIGNGTGTISASCTNSATTVGTATLSCTSAATVPGCAALNVSYTLSCPGQAGPEPTPALAVPALSEQLRILLAALVLLIGLVAVGARIRN